MAVLLATLSAVAFGVGDFLGGLSARRMAAIGAALVAQATGLALLVVVAPIAGGSPAGADLGWGIGAGVVGMAGLILFYWALGAGRMTVVAPVSAVTSALVPLAFGLADGERPSALALLGALLALPAIVLIAREPGDAHNPDELDDPPRAVPAMRVLVAAAVAGAAFGTFFVLISRSGHDSGLFPLAAARATSVLLVGVAFVVVRPGRIERVGARTAVLAGAFDVSANALFLVASRHGLLTLVGVIGSMYPASTVVLARVVLRERLAVHQLLGLGLAACSLVAVSLG